jgi:hypothetical protein
MSATKTVLGLTITREAAQADFERAAADFADDPSPVNAAKFARTKTRISEFDLAPKIAGTPQVLTDQAMIMRDHRVASPRTNRKHPSLAVPSDEIIRNL